MALHWVRTSHDCSYCCYFYQINKLVFTATATFAVVKELQKDDGDIEGIDLAHKSQLISLASTKIFPLGNTPMSGVKKNQPI